MDMEVSTYSGIKKKPFKLRLKKAFIRDWQLYILVIPALTYFFIFDFIPMYGVQIAFRDYTPAGGFTGSEWVGLEHFRRFFGAPRFWQILKNTIRLGLYGLFGGFPFPIILALIVNQCKYMKFKKVYQMIVYTPHFISITVLCGMLYVFLSPSTGILNNVVASLGGERIHFMGEPALFPHIYVWSGIWQNTGWGMIIYLAALSSISPDLYEAAKIDGATRLKTILYIEIPSIVPTIVILFIMNTGQFMSIGFQKAYLLQNPLNLNTSEIIATYVYSQGLLGAQFSYSSAIGLFNTAVNLVLILSVNTIAKKLKQTTLF